MRFFAKMHCNNQEINYQAQISLFLLVSLGPPPITFKDKSEWSINTVMQKWQMSDQWLNVTTLTDTDESVIVIVGKDFDTTCINSI